MSLHYVIAKAFDAVETLAVSEEPLRLRLMIAWIESLTHIELSLHLLPEDVVDVYRRLRTEMNRVNPASPEDGSVQASLHAMSDEQVISTASYVVLLCEQVARLDADERRRCYPAEPSAN
jgi:hypothetical protein